MFSGIVETTGIILSIIEGKECWSVTIEAPTILEDCKIGDSIAVNGICLTVIEFTESHFTINAIPETLSRTNLGELTVGSMVNLERAVLPTTRIGGHLIQGHIDTTCKFLGFENVDNGIIANFTLPQGYEQYFIDKGFIAIDGMSLTVARLTDVSFSVALIPHTISMTNIQDYHVGQIINIEVDMVGKYLQRFFEVKEKSHA